MVPPALSYRFRLDYKNFYGLSGVSYYPPVTPLLILQNKFGPSVVIRQENSMQYYAWKPIIFTAELRQVDCSSGAIVFNRNQNFAITWTDQAPPSPASILSSATTVSQTSTYTFPAYTRFPGTSYVTRIALNIFGQTDTVYASVSYTVQVSPLLTYIVGGKRPPAHDCTHTIARESTRKHARPHTIAHTPAHESTHARTRKLASLPWKGRRRPAARAFDC